MNKEFWFINQKKKKRRNQYTANDIIVYDSYAEIYLRNNKQKVVGVVGIDKEDIDKIKLHKWSLCGEYARTSINKKTIRMHRFIMEAKENQIIDHINRNTMDNRKENLHFVSPKENNQNRNKRIKNTNIHFI